jgi:hypothetical protein
MNGEGCWSTVVCTPAERGALGLTGQSEWLLHCRLAAGHRGNHASDASVRPRTDRRLWLEWNDFDDHAQSLIERNPCSFRSQHGAACLYFEGHGGTHFFAPSNGHAPAPARGPQSGAMPGQGPVQQPGQAPQSGLIPPGPPPMPPQQGPGHQSGPMQPPLPPHQPPPPMNRPAPPPPESPTPVTPSSAPPAARRRAEPASATATQESSQVMPQASMGRPPVAAGAHASGGHHDGYRPGRRSTGAEPPTTAARAGSRHRLPDADDQESQSEAPVTPPSPQPARSQPVTPPPAAPPASSTAGPAANAASSAGRSDAEIAAALRDVAAALERLAAAMR